MQCGQSVQLLNVKLLLHHVTSRPCKVKQTCVLGAFAYSRKAPIWFSTSLLMYQGGSQWLDFREIWYWWLLL